jgi:two-component system OmpR family sensor kinase
VKRIRRLSISSRITIGSLLVAALLGLVAVMVVRVGVASILHNATVTLLTNDAAPYVVSLTQDPTAQQDDPVEDQIIAILDPQGRVLVSTLPRGLVLQLRSLRGLDPGAHEVHTFTSSYLVLTRNVITSKGVFTIITARNDETANLILARLTGALVGGAIALVLCLGIASWLLARTALRPVNRMRVRAQVIAEDSSTGLLPVGPAQDELAALATTLNDLIARLRASADREKQLVSDASHELRTPLAVLQGQLELAELDKGDADALIADVRSSRATVLRLSDLATNLLELSRIEAADASGSGSDAPTATGWRALTEELADAIDRARALASNDSTNSNESAVSIDFDYRPRVTESSGSAGVELSAVSLAATDFARILDNLLSNAIRAVDGAGTITAELNRDETRVRLTVADSGPGMPVDFIPVALDRFTRADASRSAYAGGGLGLAIVSALVGSAGGTVVLANAPSSGLVVTIDLPVVMGEAPPQHREM